MEFIVKTEGAKALEKRIRSAMTDLDGIESETRLVEFNVDNNLDQKQIVAHIIEINKLIRSIREKLEKSQR